MPRTRTRTPADARCYGYARVSTSRQAKDGESLEVQERKIAGYATILGSEVVQTFVERGVSGGKPLAERTEGRRCWRR